MTMRAWAAGAAMVVAVARLAGAAECTGASGSARKVLLELYTSEGCSSCPPADRWLSKLMEAGFSPGTVIPVAFHVDYWNDLGWPDRFSQAGFSARQRAASARDSATYVYTPQFLADGHDFRGSGGYDSLRQRVRAAAAAGPAKVRLELSLDSNSTEVQVRAELDAGATAGPADLFVVVTENGLSSKVAAGENRGRSLDHDAVARLLLGPFPVAANGPTDVRQTLGLAPEWHRDRLSIVAFVQERTRGDVLQAMSLDYCR